MAGQRFNFTKFSVELWQKAMQPLWDWEIVWGPADLSMPIRNRQKHPREHPYPYHESMREFLTRIVLINQQSIDSGGDDDPSRSVNEFGRRPCCRREIAFYYPWILIGFSTERLLLIIFIQLQMSAWIMVIIVSLKRSISHIRTRTFPKFLLHYQVSYRHVSSSGNPKQACNCGKTSVSSALSGFEDDTSPSSI